MTNGYDFILNIFLLSNGDSFILFQCWIAVQDCCGEVMRGPTNNTNTVEETEAVVPFEEAIRNDNSTSHVMCSRSVSTTSSKVSFLRFN